PHANEQSEQDRCYSFKVGIFHCVGYLRKRNLFSQREANLAARGAGDTGYCGTFVLLVLNRLHLQAKFTEKSLAWL
ncbi:MAG: hypothetical protein P8Z67_09210, partial [Gammaproteobacteria bacterium]